MIENLHERFKVARWMAAKLAGTLDEKESIELESWLARSPLHLREWEEIKQAVESEGVEWLQRWQVNREWHRFEQKTGRRGHFLPRWGKYAAAVLIPLVAGVYTWYHAENPGLPATPAWEDLPPGMASAHLIMNDGQTVVLAPEKDTLIRGEEGLTVKAGSHTVTYPSEKVAPGEVTGLYHTLVVTYGAEFSLKLPDSTHVWLNAGSKLRYPLRFTDDTREVELDGEGYFEVKSEKQRTFIVKANGVEIRVLGTRFNVSSHDDRVVTTLLEGKVQLTKGSEEVTLFPDQQAIVERDGERFTVKRVVARDFTLWKDGIFWFEDVELGMILERVARWYDVTLLYQAPEVKKLRFSMEMKRYENIHAVLQKLEQTRKVKFTLDGQTLYIAQ
ncbi:MAG: FecR domain-containing protein [Odoribacteraceae bacterium]|jgi:ferric-dicitrate binding protein FerR (iron transport regulator)|nr:FecR domain-containing protein [Odoribacteraceae bacterium]